MRYPTAREAAGAVVASWRDRSDDTAPEVTEALDQLLTEILAEYALVSPSVSDSN